MPFLRDQQEEEQENPYFSGDGNYADNMTDPLGESYNENRFTDSLDAGNMGGDTSQPTSGNDYYKNQLDQEKSTSQNNNNKEQDNDQEKNEEKPEEKKDNKLDEAADALGKVPGPVGTVAKAYKHRKIIIITLVVIITFLILFVVILVGLIGSKLGGIPKIKKGTEASPPVSGNVGDIIKFANLYSDEINAKTKIADKDYNRIATGDVTDCGRFVSSVMRQTKLDTSFPIVSTAVIFPYLQKSTKYTEIRPKSTKDLQPGDIIIAGPGGGYRYGHVFIWAGDKGVKGGNSWQASLGSHSPDNLKRHNQTKICQSGCRYKHAYRLK